MKIIKRIGFSSLVFILICSLACVKKQSNFNSIVLGDFGRHSYYIVLDVDCNSINQKIVIENSYLYYLVNKSDSLDQIEYKKYVGSLLASNDTLHLNGSCGEDLKFAKATTDEEVNNNAQKGKEKFIEMYFTNKVLHRNISDETRNAIIQKLFQWEIPCKVDDESGYLVVYW